ncbi:MAG TPA: peptide-methionine (S)-S-oxide reductase MsrA [Allosphingosinicella sp.]|jgi:peptide-methionine (S)-S-oxide reductase
MYRFFLWLLPLALAACSESSPAQAPAQGKRTQAVLVVAGGCFWCTEADFEKVPGVAGAVSGYAGGRTERPTYESVTAGGTGHYEAVRVVYDPARVSYPALVRHYFRTIDPTDAGGQFCDRGESYRTAIFVRSPEERRIAEAEKARVSKQLGRRVATAILPTGRFWPAEGYHQDYYKKNSIKYRFYRSRCGRDPRLREVWGFAAK